MKTVYNILCALFGVGMIIFGANKLHMFLPMPEKMAPEQLKVMEAFGTISWLMPLAGVAEILGGILMIFPKTRALGAIVIFPIILGILAHNLTYFDAKGFAVPLVFALINFWAIFKNRNKYAQLLD